jgi:hypothetical protein
MSKTLPKPEFPDELRLFRPPRGPGPTVRQADLPCRIPEDADDVYGIAALYREPEPLGRDVLDPTTHGLPTEDGPLGPGIARGLWLGTVEGAPR